MITMCAGALLFGCTIDNRTVEDGGGAGADGGSSGGDGGGQALTYPVVDTAQGRCYGDKKQMTCASAGAAYFGQDAQWQGNAPRYAVSKDGKTVRDLVTGLTWQRSPDTNGDGKILFADKLTHTEAKALPAKLNAAKYGGFSDWRLPHIKELYSLIDFRGTDPSGASGTSTAGLIPFIDSKAFAFAYGDVSAGERIIDSQYASSTLYVSKAAGEMLFGVNFADGRIKGYGLKHPSGKVKTFLVQCVRGNTSYGKNSFKDNGDGSITDAATGLTWTRADSGKTMNWKEALVWVASKNAAKYLGKSDWRLPNVKELQSIVDYTRSPDTTKSAAIDPIFSVSKIKNEAGADDYPYYWSSTTHANSNGMGGGASYVAFGRSPGFMNGSWRDVHGAGSQRSDPKSGDPKQYPQGHGPQGDAIRIYNHVRLVSGGATLQAGGGKGQDGGHSRPKLDGGVPPKPDQGGGPGPVSCTQQSDCTKPGACPPGAKLGCKCVQGPPGGSKVCAPACKTDADCPKPPGITLTCDTKLGACRPK